VTDRQRYTDITGMALYENADELELDDAIRELKRLSSIVDVMYIDIPTNRDIFAIRQMVDIIDAIEVPMRISNGLA
tara:strand:- start:95 stop:322 length:228 start_codon:yes stop_codon:yes gene_type:complete